MTTTGINKQKTGVGTEKIEGTSSEKELVANLSETPLTVEQQVVQLRGEVKNLNAGIFELLELFKEVLKKQVSTEAMIENLVPKMSENIAKVSKQVENITPTKDKILNSIFSGKNMGGIEYLGSRRVLKVNMEEYIQDIQTGGGDYRYCPESFNEKGFDTMMFGDIKTAQGFMLYCMNVFLNLKDEGIKIEDRKRKDMTEREIFCTGHGFSWTINDIKGIIKNYYGTEYDAEVILKYILYLHKKYSLKRKYE